VLLNQAHFLVKLATEACCSGSFKSTSLDHDELSSAGGRKHCWNQIFSLIFSLPGLNLLCEVMVTGGGEPLTPAQADASCMLASVILAGMGRRWLAKPAAARAGAFPRLSSTYLLGEAEQGNPTGLGS